jgi:hypothetical protein
MATLSVPDTTDFSLQDVCDVILGSQDDLVECFAEASANYFNPAYEGSKNSLLNFRDYGIHNSFILTANPSSLEWQSGDNRVIKITDITITPDVTFSAILTGVNAAQFTILLVDNVTNKISLRNNGVNVTGLDWVASLDISAPDYPDEDVKLKQFST